MCHGKCIQNARRGDRKCPGKCIQNLYSKCESVIETVLNMHTEAVEHVLEVFSKYVLNMRKCHRKCIQKVLQKVYSKCM